MKMTKHLLAAFGAAGLLAVSGGAFAGDTSVSASASVDESGTATTSVQTNGSASKVDSKLEKKIEAKLERDRQLKGDQVDATVSAGTVTLTGTVDKDSDKSRAERLVSAMKGVKSVDNQIQVASADSVLAPGSAGTDVGGAIVPAPGSSSDVVPSATGSGTVGSTGAQGSTGSSADTAGSVVRERTNRVEERREVEIQRPSERSSGSTGSMNSEREMRNQTSGGTTLPDPGVDSLPGSGARDNGALPGAVTPPAGGPRPLPLPSEPASPSRRSTDSPGTERLPTSPSSGDYHNNGASTPGTTGASPGTPLR